MKDPIYKPSGRAKEYGDYAGKRYTVYIRLAPNGKRYVGMTSKPLHIRASKDGNNYRANKALYSDIERFGWGSFTSEVVADGLTYDEAIQLETATIRSYDTTNPENGYNEIESPGAWKRDEAERARVGKQMSAANKGKKLSEEHRRKLSEAQKGKPKNITDEGRARIIESNRTRVYSEETRKRMSENTKAGMAASGALEKLRQAWASDKETRRAKCRNQYSQLATTTSRTI